MKILVAIDFSPITTLVLEKTKEIALKANASVWLTHIVAPDPDFIGYEVGPQTERDFIARKFHEKHIALQDLAKKLREEKVQIIPLLLQGPTVETILQEADDIDADMIIAGSHGHGMMYNIFIGSISKEILKHSSRPVLIVPVKNGNKSWKGSDEKVHEAQP